MHRSTFGRLVESCRAMAETVTPWEYSRIIFALSTQPAFSVRDLVILLSVLLISGANDNSGLVLLNGIFTSCFFGGKDNTILITL